MKAFTIPTLIEKSLFIQWICECSNSDSQVGNITNMINNGVEKLHLKAVVAVHFSIDIHLQMF